jgi:hypothetical protein
MIKGIDKILDKNFGKIMIFIIKHIKCKILGNKKRI